VIIFHPLLQIILYEENSQGAASPIKTEQVKHGRIKSMGYTKDFLKGLGWIGAFRLSAKAIVFFKVIVAYRYLSPREVGLFGLVSIAIGLLEMLTETGINVVLVRDTRPISYYLDTAFIVSIVRGILISLVLLLSALLLPSFFHDGGLFVLLLYASIIPVIKGFINPAEAKFVKDLTFQREAIFRVGLQLVDGIGAILLVQYFHSAASLVWAMILTALTEVIYSQLFITPRPRFAFNKEVYRSIIDPGKWVNASGIITFAEQNFDNIIVGRVLGAEALGFYQTAFNLTRSLIAEIGTAFSQVLLPIYGRLVHEQSRMRRAVIKLIVPAALLMLIPTIALNTHIVQEGLIYFLHDKWRPALQLFFPLSICALLTGMDTLINPLFVARNKIKELVMLYTIGLALMIIFMYWFTREFGLSGAALAVMASRIILQPFFIWQTLRVIRLDTSTTTHDA
jgi:O-antigen/teichoic acid export membrane protein